MTMIEFTGAGLVAGFIFLFIGFIGICLIPEIENLIERIKNFFKKKK